MKTRVAVMAATMLALGFAQKADCGTRSISIQDSAVIESPQGDHRVLLALEPITGFDRAVLTNAWLEIPLPAVQGAETAVELQVHPIVVEWNPRAVDWETGWTTPGGDLDEIVYSRDAARVEMAGRTLRVDLTVMIRESVEHGRAFHGLLLTCPPYQGQGFTTADMVRLGNLASWAVRVTYERVDKWPRKAGRGIG